VGFGVRDDGVAFTAAAVERRWQMSDSQGQTLALALGEFPWLQVNLHLLKSVEGVSSSIGSGPTV